MSASALAVGQVNGQALWQIKAGASYMRSGDPLGTGHGPYTGHAVDGMGYHAGVAFEPEVRKIGVRAELLFDVRSTGYTFNNNVVVYQGHAVGGAIMHGERRMRAMFVELPVMLAVHAWPRLRLEAGLAPAYLVKAEERLVGERVDEPVDERTDRTNDLARWEGAAVIGAEVDSGQRLSMGLRLWKGLTDLDRAEGSTISTTTMWQFSMAYALGEVRRAL